MLVMKSCELCIRIVGVEQHACAQKYLLGLRGYVWEKVGRTTGKHRSCRSRNAGNVETGFNLLRHERFSRSNDDHMRVGSPSKSIRVSKKNGVRCAPTAQASLDREHNDIAGQCSYIWDLSREDRLVV